MPTFTETSTLQSLEIFPALNVINVKKLNTTFKDGVKFAEQVDAKSYSTSQFSDFEMTVAPTGGTLAEIVAGFSQAALDAASALPATLAAKDAELAAAATAHAAALAAKDAEIAALEAQVAELAPPTVNGVPQVVTRRQARQALLLAGLLDSIEPAIAAIPDTTQRRLAQIEWDDSQNFERQRPLLISLATGLGLTSAQLDQLFVTASGL